MNSNRSIPAATVIPVLVYPDVRAAVAWLSGAFGFVERVRIGEDHLGGHRWQFTQTLRDVAPEEWGGVTVASSVAPPAV